ncbi:MAG TPA: right-handed parallel beta-helix repeat-containing protein [bacterium]|nr:right-handed parallel beta-helix repeat-containing protein [bacterium]
MKAHSSIEEITVGPKNADIRGSDGKAIQAAIDLAAIRHIPRVLVKKGIYGCKNTIMLRSGIDLSGEGEMTVIRREPYKKSLLIKNVNHYERFVSVKHPDYFTPGCVVTIKGKWSKSFPAVTVRACVVGKKGYELFLDRPYIGKNFWLEAGPVEISSLGPLICGEDVEDVLVHDVQIDGNIPFDGMERDSGSGIYLRNCRGAVIRNVFSHNNNGDGIGFEISNDVTVEECLAENNNMPIHAGSGSLRMCVRNNILRKNRYGFFFCWGIQQGILEKNEISDNKTFGVSVGFEDSHNIIRNNRIIGNRDVGIIFQTGHHPSQAPCDDTVEGNLIENNGPRNNAVAVKIDSTADDIRIIGNRIIETRKGRKSTAVLIEKSVKKVLIEKNEIKGFRNDIVDCRIPASKSVSCGCKK